MREIKFRAWNKKEMNYKVLIGNLDPNDENYTAGSILVNNEWLQFDEHSDLQIMQYTGLRDKGGNEIFEGDIIGETRVGKNPEAIGRVVFDDDFLTFVLEKTNGGFEYLGEYISDHRHDEIIGNIFENPELLKEK
jgi:uncharacterized phage protein (TIGR01671 family)